MKHYLVLAATSIFMAFSVSETSSLAHPGWKPELRLVYDAGHMVDVSTKTIGQKWKSLSGIEIIVSQNGLTLSDLNQVADFRPDPTSNCHRTQIHLDYFRTPSLPGPGEVDVDFTYSVRENQNGNALVLYFQRLQRGEVQVGGYLSLYPDR